LVRDAAQLVDAFPGSSLKRHNTVGLAAAFTDVASSIKLRARRRRTLVRREDRQ
jgi:hypothetical protein